jgi:hypothetical protein
MKLVFAHFVTPLPSHLLENMARTRVLFPNEEIVLITDLDVALSQLNITIHKYENIHEQQFLKDGLSHPMEFRNQFWLTTLLRVIAVCDYSISIKDSIIHIESDVILASNFPLLKFASLNHEVAFPLVSSGLGVASTLFIKNREAATNLIDFIHKEVSKNSNTTDMKILYNYYIAHPGRVMVLPTAINLPGIFNGFSGSVTSAILIEGVNCFEGIFDTVDIGFYLLGEDPRNHRGFTHYRTLDDSSFVNIRFLSFSFNEKTKFLELENPITKSNIPIFSLHIHSKNNKAIDAKSSPRILRRAISKQHDSSDRKFNLKVFLALTKHYLMKRMVS